MKKHLICLLLTFVMIVGILPLSSSTTFAAETKITEYYCLDITAWSEENDGLYINTDYIPTSKTSVLFDAEIISDSAVLFGVDYYADNKHHAFYINAGYDAVNANVFGAGWGTGDDWGWTGAPLLHKRQTIALKPGKFLLNERSYKTFRIVDFAKPGLPMYLFALNFYGDKILNFPNQHIRFYSCQIYEGDKLVLNFVPATYNNKVGVFDKVNGKFYEIKGNGTTKCLERKTIDEVQFCAEAGHKKYYTFDGKAYKDENCTQEIVNFDTWLTIEGSDGGMLKPLGHVWVNAEQNKDGESSLKTAGTCGKNAIYYKVCERCGAFNTNETWEKPDTSLVHDWKSKSANMHICLNCEKLEKHTFKNGECTVCGRKENDDNNYFTCSWKDHLQKVVSYQQAIPNNATTLTENDTNLSSGWYIVRSDVEFDTKLTINGTAENPTNIILANGATLTVNNGIIVEGNNVLNIYAQSEDENTMGRLVATTNGVSAISSTKDCGKVYIYGGKILFDCTNAPCIAAANGKDGVDGVSGHSSSRHGSSGENGGNINGIYFYGGISYLKSSETCIKSGNGGHGGQGANDNENDGFDVGGSGGGDGGDGGNAGDLKVFFYGGNTIMESNQQACILCGSGGPCGGGGTHFGYGGSYARGAWGKGNSPSITISNNAIIKAGGNQQDALSVDAYNNQKYLSVQYNNDNTSFIGSVLSNGSWLIVGGIMVIGVITFIIVKKKKTQSLVSGEKINEE